MKPLLNADGMHHRAIGDTLRAVNRVLGGSHALGLYVLLRMNMMNDPDVRRVRRVMSLSQFHKWMPLRWLVRVFEFILDVENARGVPMVCRAFRGVYRF